MNDAIRDKNMSSALRDAARQDQFLDVVSREEAEARLRRHLRLRPLGVERVGLAAVRGRVLAEDVVAPVDVPGFDRSNVDGFAVRAADTVGASDERRRRAAAQRRGAGPRRGARAPRSGRDGDA